MAAGRVHYTLTEQDVQTIIQIGAGRRVRSLPAAAGEEYAALVVRSPTPEHSGNQNWADLLVFVDGSQPYFVRDVQLGTGQAGTFSTTRLATVVGGGA